MLVLDEKGIVVQSQDFVYISTNMQEILSTYWD